MASKLQLLVSIITLQALYLKCVNFSIAKL